MNKLRPRSIYDVFALLALVVALGGTGAYAANTIRSSDIVDNEVGSADVKDNSINTFDVHSFLGVDVVDNTLTGDDIDESTLVGVKATCPGGTVLLGRLCVGGDGSLREWLTAAQYCATLGLRLPTTGESLLTAQNYNIPAIADTDFFWTDDVTGNNTVVQRALVSDNAQFISYNPASTAAQTVCVATPTDA